ncbi:MAG: NADH-quinone oxidoreductase subunit L, partial [Acidobacteria bacterium]|nr:NADH-quinone oxidoreductase subunit L [Acidobacteriota bacterium]
FTEILPAIQAGHFEIGAPVMTAIALLLFVGATGKSAQIPLYVWLPDAMEGPTPVSALIHAATMVTAGVYMVTRSNAIFQLSPVAMETVAVIGAVTAIFAASMGLVQNDIKRVLAYSTISQLGYMFLACGVGAFVGGIFHLMTHAFFKALLFLGSGSVIHAMSGEQDMRKMGGLWSKIPTTAKTMLAGTLAIAGIPPLAGFFSKDEILGKTFEHSRALWLVGFITAGMTAFYMFRLVNMTFFGKSRVDHDVEHHIHESPRSMTGVLVILAVLSIIGGWIGWPVALGGGNRFEHFLEPVIAKHGGEVAETASMAAHASAAEYLLMLASVGVAALGIWLAYVIYLKREGAAERMAASWSGVHNLLYHKYYMDEIYDALFVNRTKDLATTLGAFDRTVIDGMGVDGSAWLTRFVSRVSIWWDTWIVDGLVNLSGRIVWIFSFPVRLVQNGLVQSYALVIVAGVLLIFGYYLTR